MQASYSHIYVEEGVRNLPFAGKILQKFPKAQVVNVRDYKEVFNRGAQSFEQQKRSPKLLLAAKKEQFIYDGSRFVQEADNPNFVYNALSLNCAYDCAYCYLQGMYASANQVCFVNLDDFFSATGRAIQNRPDPEQPLYLCISYDTDLLAFESVAPYCREWIGYCQGREGKLEVEIRTKSANFPQLADLEPRANVILAWSLSPDTVCQRYEHKTPPLRARLKSMAQAVRKGWRVRLCIDPILAVEDWQDAYAGLVASVREHIELERLHDVHLGVFRMNADHFGNIRKRRSPVDLYYRQWERGDGTVMHPKAEREQLTGYVAGQFSGHVDLGRVRIW